MSQKTVKITSSDSVIIKIEDEDSPSPDRNVGATTDSETIDIKTEIKTEDIDKEVSILPTTGCVVGEIKREGKATDTVAQKECAKCDATPTLLNVFNLKNMKLKIQRILKIEKSKCPFRTDVTLVEPFSCTMCKFKTSIDKVMDCHMLEHQKTKSDPTLKLETNKDLSEETEEAHISPWKKLKLNNTKTAVQKRSKVNDETLAPETINETIAHKKRPAPQDDPDSADDDPASPIYRCPFCIFQTPNEKFIFQHYVTHHDIGLQVKTFRCDICDFQCTNNQSLIMHMEVHKKSIEFKCDLCSYETPRKCALVSHKKRHEKAARRMEYKSATCLF